MEQLWYKVNFGSRQITYLDEIKKEDMLQVEYPNHFLLDMGWYQDRYVIHIIQNFDWEHPVMQYIVEDENQLSNILVQAICDIEKVSKNLLNCKNREGSINL